MKMLVVIALVLGSVSASAAEILASISSYNMLEASQTTIVLKDDGILYESTGKLGEKSSREKKVARVTEETQIPRLIEMISQIPANAQLEKEDTSIDCGLDGGASVLIFSDRFEDGRLVIQDAGCGTRNIVGKNAYMAAAIVRLMESYYSVRK